MTKSIINGKEVIRGVFQSTRKYVKKLSGIGDGEEMAEGEIKYLYTNNQMEHLNNNSISCHTYSYQKTSAISFNNVLIICSLVIFFSLLVDLFKYKELIKSENAIELNMCILEFKANECEKLSIEDGPILNNFCKEKKKCIEYYNQVFFLKLLSRYITDVLGNIFSPQLNLAKLGTACVILLTTSLAMRILK